MKSFYVYLILDPRNFYIPFYVGKGRGARIKGTLYTKNNNIKRNTIRKIREAGYEPVVSIWKDGLTESEAFALEAALIARFGRRANGTGILANLTDGGGGTSGYNHSASSRNKMSASQKKRVQEYGPRLHSEEHKQRLRENNPGGKATARPVLQIASDGTVIREWPSSRTAGETLGTTYANIANQSKDGSIRQVAGFWWRWSDSKEIVENKLITVQELDKQRKRPKQIKSLIQKNLDGEIAIIWSSYQEAADVLGLKYPALWAATKFGRTYAGYLWERG